MNKSLILSAMLLFISGHALAEKKNCNDLKSEIAAGMDKKGVKNYTLDIVDVGSAKETDKVVGSCDGGTKKIVYRRN